MRSDLPVRCSGRRPYPDLSRHTYSRIELKTDDSDVRCATLTRRATGQRDLTSVSSSACAYVEQPYARDSMTLLIFLAFSSSGTLLGTVTQTFTRTLGAADDRPCHAFHSERAIWCVRYGYVLRGEEQRWCKYLQRTSYAVGEAVASTTS